MTQDHDRMEWISGVMIEARTEDQIARLMATLRQGTARHARPPAVNSETSSPEDWAAAVEQLMADVTRRSAQP